MRRNSLTASHTALPQKSILEFLVETGINIYSPNLLECLCDEAVEKNRKWRKILNDKYNRTVESPEISPADMGGGQETGEPGM